MANSSIPILTTNQPKPFSVSSFNPNVLNLEYAVRGPILNRALDISNELKHDNSWPFNEIIFLNIGNPQNLGQKPITFCRQLLSLCCYPDLIEDIDVKQIFPNDVIERARIFLNSIASFGGYSHSLGFELVRKEVANFIKSRDNCEVDFNNIFLSDGASKIISVIISCLAKNEGNVNAGILIPIPQYPLYSATLTYYGIKSIPYYLDQNSEWGLDIQDISMILEKCKGTCIPRAIVVINPGNPTGQCLKFNEQVELLKFCHVNDILLLADEVYQDNIYSDKCNWLSFRKVYSTIEVN